MPIICEHEETDGIELDELVAFMEDQKIDTRSHDEMLSTGQMLAKLGNNKRFIADIALNDLKSRRELDTTSSSYGPQTIMLYHERHKNFYVRANFWPAENDHIFRSSGATAFFYYTPHDHSFNFMTVGYFGPGYESNYFEYEYADTDGYPGERVDLKFVETSCLNEGKVMLYRAFVDVHDQRPAKAMSMSINIMENTFRGGFMDQYNFDIDKGEVTDVINRIGASSLLPVLALSGDDNARDFLVETAVTHRSGRVRCIAISSLAAAAGSLADARREYEAGAASDISQVRGFCRGRLDILDQLVA